MRLTEERLLLGARKHRAGNLVILNLDPVWTAVPAGCLEPVGANDQIRHQTGQGMTSRIRPECAGDIDSVQPDCDLAELRPARHVHSNEHLAAADLVRAI